MKAQALALAVAYVALIATFLACSRRAPEPGKLESLEGGATVIQAQDPIPEGGRVAASWEPLAPAKDGRPFAIPVTPANVNGVDVPPDYVLVTTRRGANLWASPEAYKAYGAR